MHSPHLNIYSYDMLSTESAMYGGSEREDDDGEKENCCGCGRKMSKEAGVAVAIILFVAALAAAIFAIRYEAPGSHMGLLGGP